MTVHITKSKNNQFPADLWNLVRHCNKEHPTNTDKAEKHAFNNLTKLKSYGASLERALIHYALRQLIYEARCTQNHKIKHSADRIKRKPPECKVDIMHSSTIINLHNRWYDYRIAGRTLGTLYGRELQQIADTERSISKGHLANAKLLEELKPLVPANKMIKDVIKPTALNRIARRYLKAA